MSGDLLKRLAAAGTPMDLIMEVAETLADAKAAERLLERRRAKDRERKRHSMDSAETVEIVETSENPSPQSPPLKSPPDPQKITPPLTPQPVVEDARDPVEILWEAINAIAEDVRKKLPPPIGVDDGQWRAFRRQRKKALTDRAYLMICRKLSGLAEAGWPPGDMIDLAIERGWETVFEPKDQANGRQPNHQPVGGLRGSRPDPSLDFVRQANADLAAERGGSPDHRRDWASLPSGGSS